MEGNMPTPIRINIDEVKEQLETAERKLKKAVDDTSYHNFIKEVKELINSGMLKDVPLQNPYIWMLRNFPEGYWVNVNRFYETHYAKHTEEYKNNDPYYLGKTLLNDDGTISDAIHLKTATNFMEKENINFKHYSFDNNCISDISGVCYTDSNIDCTGDEMYISYLDFRYH